MPVFAFLAPGDCYPEEGLVNIPINPPLVRISYLAKLRGAGDKKFMEPLIKEIRRAVQEVEAKNGPSPRTVQGARARKRKRVTKTIEQE